MSNIHRQSLSTSAGRRALRILYLDCDTVRPDHLGAYGYHRDTSPNIDRIAAEGVRFDRCYVSDAPCLPSRAALFLGRLGVHTGIVGHAGSAAETRFPGDLHSMDPTALPLAAVLSAGGTDAVTFSTFHQRHLAWWFTAGWREVHRFSESTGDELAADVGDSAADWLRHNARREDWFLHVHFWDAHTPYNTPVDYGEPFADSPAPDFPTAEVLAEQLTSYGPLGARDAMHTFGGRIAGDVASGSPRHPDALDDLDGVKRWVDGYDTGIRYMDDAIGRLLDVLADQGVLDDTAIIISADHGENQGELNRYGSHTTADAITCRVPLIVRWPGLDAGTVRDDPIYQLDLAPTLCELLGLEAPSRWDGRSFASVLEGGEIETRPYLVLGQGSWCVQRAVLQSDLLYIRTLDPALDPMPNELLFDLAEDPHEQHDLAGRRPDETRRLAGLLDEWWHDHAGRVGDDPLLRIIREGGAPYVRLIRDRYLQRLRDTGREAIADELAQRNIRPVPDPFDFRRG